MMITACAWAKSTLAVSSAKPASKRCRMPRVDDYTIVHAGFALSILSEEEALETLNLLRDISSFNDETGLGLGAN